MFLNLFCSIHFSVKSKITEILRGVQIYGTEWKLKSGLKDFNEIWCQQYRFTVVYSALHLISKYLRGKFLEGQFFLHQQVHKSVDEFKKQT